MSTLFAHISLFLIVEARQPFIQVGITTMLKKFMKLLFLFQTVFVRAKGITYTTYTGKCVGVIDYENEAGKRVFNYKDCVTTCYMCPFARPAAGSTCNQDEACTGYNTKKSDRWCHTYTSKFFIENFQIDIKQFIQDNIH